MPGQAMQHLLLLMIGGEDRSLAPENVDVAAESGRGLVDDHVQVQAKCVELLCVERPRVALRGEDRRTRGVERAQGMHQGRIVLGFGEVVEIVRIFAEIDEAAVARGIGWDQTMERQARDRLRNIRQTIQRALRTILALLADSFSGKRRLQALARRKRRSVCSAQ